MSMMSTAEVAEATGLKSQTITKHIRAKRLRARKNRGRDWQILEADFEDWLLHRRRAGRPRQEKAGGVRGRHPA